MRNIRHPARLRGIFAAGPLAMLTEIYIEALLVDEGLADWVWEAWDAGEISDVVAVWAWLLISRNVTCAKKILTFR